MPDHCTQLEKIWSEGGTQNIAGHYSCSTIYCSAAKATLWRWWWARIIMTIMPVMMLTLSNIEDNDPVLSRSPWETRRTREACHGVRPKFWKFESISFGHNLNVVKSNDSTIGFHCCRSCCLAYLPSFQRVHFQCASWAPTSLHFSNGGLGWGGLRWTVGGNNMHTRNTHSFDTKDLYTLSVVRSSGVMYRLTKFNCTSTRVILERAGEVKFVVLTFTCTSTHAWRNFTVRRDNAHDTQRQLNDDGVRPANDHPTFTRTSVSTPPCCRFVSRYTRTQLRNDSSKTK